MKLKKIFLGLLIGFVSGLFSSGGGILALIVFSQVLKIPEKESRAMTIFCMLPIVLSSLIIYSDANFVNVELGIICAIGGSIGGLIGSILLDKISDKALNIIFIVFLLYSSFNLFFCK